MVAKSKVSTLESSKSSNQAGIKPPIMGGLKTEEQAVMYESSFGDVSSIMIMPDQIYNNFNLLEDEERSPNKKVWWTYEW